MTEIKAIDLPDGSVVAKGGRIYLKSADDAELPWIYIEAGSMYVNYSDDDETQDALDEGGQMLRYGYGAAAPRDQVSDDDFTEFNAALRSLREDDTR